jgi:hypothetical protein
MVDWATVALSGIGSLGGILVTVLMERRRENVQRLESVDRRVEALDARMRSSERAVAALETTSDFFSGLATGDLKKKLRKMGGR